MLNIKSYIFTMILGSLLAFLVIKKNVLPPGNTYMDPENAFSLSIYIKDFPVYPKAVLQDGAKYNQTHTPTAVWNSQESVEKVADWYKETLQTKGWKIESVSEKQVNLDLIFMTFVRYDQKLNLSIIHQADSQATQIFAEFIPPANFE